MKKLMTLLIVTGMLISAGSCSEAENLEQIKVREQVGTPEEVGTPGEAKQQSQIAKMERQASDLLSTGTVYSINIEYNEARINPSLWLQMTLNQKQSLVFFFSAYFDAKGSTGRVTILSSRNDTKLASYGSWGGLKIYF